jgi:hypothetical protein
MHEITLHTVDSFGPNIRPDVKYKELVTTSDGTVVWNVLSCVVIAIIIVMDIRVLG